MKSDSQIMNELAHKTSYLREMSPEESASMKNALLDMYQDLLRVCEKHNLTLMLCGGSCLGAVRHHGFIPWDDDLDVMMPRADYDRLISLLHDNAMGEKYEYNAPNPETDCKNAFLKIYLKKSLDVDLFSKEAPFPKGLYIDVFALDAVPKSKFMQHLKGFVANGLQFCSILTLYAQYPSTALKEYMALDKQLKRRYKIKVALGKIVGIIPHKKWVWWFDKFVSSSKENRPWGIPTGRKYYCGEIFDKSVYYPSIEAEFEGIKCYIPNKFDVYLTNLYHNYWELPPLEKRERHFICEFKLPED